MTQEHLFSLALMVNKPWFVSKIDFDPKKNRIDIDFDFERGATFFYEKLDEQISGYFKAYDTTKKTWRHLNFFQSECYLHVFVPRVDIGNGQCRLVNTPWEGKVFEFALLMKALILQLAFKMPVHQIGKLISVTDNRIWRLLKSYVSLARDAQDMSGVTQLGVDETAVLRGHNYVTLFVDLEKRKTIFVTEGIRSKGLELCKGTS